MENRYNLILVPSATGEANLLHLTGEWILYYFTKILIYIAVGPHIYKANINLCV